MGVVDFSITINLASPITIPPGHYTILCREPNSRSTPNILHIHTTHYIRPISSIIAITIITIVVAVVVVVVKVLLLLLLLLPALLSFPVSWPSNHCRHRHLLWSWGRTPKPPKRCWSKVVLFLGVCVGGCGFICGVCVGKSGEEEGRDGGFASTGLDYRWDLWVRTSWRIHLWNGLVLELVSGSSPFDLL